MKILAEKIKCKDLKPGDLFSIGNSEYWEHERFKYALLPVGEKVYIRTEAPMVDMSEAESSIYLITIEK